MRIPVSFVLLALTQVSPLTSMAQEKKIRRADLPAAVAKTVRAQSQNAVIRGLSEEKENRRLYYEVQMTVEGHGKEILMDSKGAIVEVEVAFDSLPSPIKEGLQIKAGKGKIVNVESVTKRDTLVAYEAQVTTGGRRSEIQVGPEEKPLDHEE